MAPKRTKRALDRSGDIVQTGKIVRVGPTSEVYVIKDTSVTLNQLCQCFDYDVAEFRRLNQDNPFLGLTTEQLSSRRITNAKTKFNKNTVVVCRGEWTAQNLRELRRSNEVTSSVDKAIKETRPPAQFICETCGDEFVDIMARMRHGKICRRKAKKARLAQQEQVENDDRESSEASGGEFGVREYSDDDDDPEETPVETPVETSRETSEEQQDAIQDTQENQPGMNSQMSSQTSQTDSQTKPMTLVTTMSSPQQSPRPVNQTQMAKPEQDLRALLKQVSDVRDRFDMSKNVFDGIEEELSGAYAFTRREDLKILKESFQTIRDCFKEIPTYDECYRHAKALRSFIKALDIKSNEASRGLQTYFDMIESITGKIEFIPGASTAKNFEVLKQHVEKHKIAFRNQVNQEDIADMKSAMDTLQAHNAKLEADRKKLVFVRDNLQARMSGIVAVCSNKSLTMQQRLETIVELTGSISFEDVQRHAMHHVLPLYEKFKTIRKEIDDFRAEWRSQHESLKTETKLLMENITENITESRQRLALYADEDERL